MKRVLFASNSLLGLPVLTCPRPTRCPYCPADAPHHWTRSGSYQRYAGDPDDPSRRVVVPRYLCKIHGRTFSLPPDALLPYCGMRAGYVLQCLYALSVQGVAVNTLARHAGVARGTLRCLKTRFLRAIARLRLPWREGALNAAGWLTALAVAGATAVAGLFRDWKEHEPKLSVVGIYVR